LALRRIQIFPVDFASIAANGLFDVRRKVANDFNSLQVTVTICAVAIAGKPTTPQYIANSKILRAKISMLLPL
jgi:hypothetical protein